MLIQKRFSINIPTPPASLRLPMSLGAGMQLAESSLPMMLVHLCSALHSCIHRECCFQRPTQSGRSGQFLLYRGPSQDCNICVLCAATNAALCCCQWALWPAWLQSNALTAKKGEHSACATRGWLQLHYAHTVGMQGAACLHNQGRHRTQQAFGCLNMGGTGR